MPLFILLLLAWQAETARPANQDRPPAVPQQAAQPTPADPAPPNPRAIVRGKVTALESGNPLKW
jgi:hypothetical protein